jgi:hypothetical protein
MDLINLLLVPLVGIAAYYAFASAYGHARRSKWMHAAWTTAAGMLLAGCGLYLVFRAIHFSV